MKLLCTHPVVLQNLPQPGKSQEFFIKDIFFNGNKGIRTGGKTHEF